MTFTKVASFALLLLILAALVMVAAFTGAPKLGIAAAIGVGGLLITVAVLGDRQVNREKADFLDRQLNPTPTVPTPTPGPDYAAIERSIMSQYSPEDQTRVVIFPNKFETSPVQRDKLDQFLKLYSGGARTKANIQELPPSDTEAGRRARRALYGGSDKIGLEQPSALETFQAEDRTHRVGQVLRTVDFGYAFDEKHRTVSVDTENGPQALTMKQLLAGTAELRKVSDGKGNFFNVQDDGSLLRVKSPSDNWYDLNFAPDAIPTQFYIDNPDQVAPDLDTRDAENRHDKGYPKA